MPVKTLIKVLLLYPFAATYRVGSLIHKRYILKATIKKQLTPLIRIGGLQSGGDHKTPVVALLAQEIVEDGHNCAILVYNIYKSGSNSPLLVAKGAKHPFCSDEAVLLSNLLKSDVYACRDRFTGYKSLSEKGYDYILSDGGIEDPRLDFAYTILLQKHPFPKHIHQLLPIGSWRSFLNDHRSIHEIWRHDSIKETEAHAIPNYLFASTISSIQSTSGEIASTKNMYTILTSIAHAAQLRKSILQYGITIDRLVSFRDHFKDFSIKIEHFLAKNHHKKVIITEKDAIKLDSHLLNDPRIFVTKLLITKERTIGQLLNDVNKYSASN